MSDETPIPDPLEGVTDPVSDPPLTDTKAPEKATEGDPKNADPKESVEYVFKDAPEGYDVEGLKAFAKENGISPAAAQKLLDRDLSARAKAQEFREQAKKEGIASILNDKELGGEHLEKTKVNVKTAWDSLSRPMRETIEKRGMRQDPDMIRLLNEIGSKARAPATPPGGSPPEPQQKNLNAMDRLQGIYAKPANTP